MLFTLKTLTKYHWNKKDLAILAKRIAQMLNSGFLITKALDVSISFYMISAKRKILQNVLNEILAGTNLTSAFVKVDFPSFFVAMVKIGEENGNLAEGFQQIAKYYDERNRFEQQLINSLIYPMILLISIVFFFVFTDRYIIPQFVRLYSAFNFSMPKILQYYLAIKDYIHIGLIIFFSIIILFLIILFLIKKIKEGKYYNFIIHLPIYSTILRLMFTYLFTMQLGILLQGGTPILNALIIIKEYNQGYLWKIVSTKLTEEIMTGKNFLASSANIKFLLVEELAKWIEPYELGGEIGKGLLDFSQILYERIESLLKFILNWVQPILIIFVGLLVLFMVITLLVPMFSLIK